MAKILRDWTQTAVTISSGAAISGSVVIAGRSIVNILMPEVWTAASLSFDVAACPGGTFYALYDTDGSEVAIPAAACRAISGSDLGYLSGWIGMRIRSGSSAGDPDNQAAERTLVVCAAG